MTDKFLRRIGLGALIVVPAVAFGVIEGTSLLIPPTTAETSSRTAEKPDSASVANTLAIAPAPASILPAANATSALINSAPAGQGSADFPIHDADLKSLGAMVDLGDAARSTPDKQRWTRALSIAENLLQGPCDCEQRNWLSHFVTMGNAALSDSPDYYKLAQVMPTLALNDQRNTYY